MMDLDLPSINKLLFEIHLLTVKASYNIHHRESIVDTEFPAFGVTMLGKEGLVVPGGSSSQTTPITEVEINATIPYNEVDWIEWSKSDNLKEEDIE
jgi:hypothetical protein